MKYRYISDDFKNIKFSDDCKGVTMIEHQSNGGMKIVNAVEFTISNSIEAFIVSDLSDMNKTFSEMIGEDDEKYTFQKFEYRESVKRWQTFFN